MTKGKIKKTLDRILYEEKVLFVLCLDSTAFFAQARSGGQTASSRITRVSGAVLFEPSGAHLNCPIWSASQ